MTFAALAFGVLPAGEGGPVPLGVSGVAQAAEAEAGEPGPELRRKTKKARERAAEATRKSLRENPVGQREFERERARRERARDIARQRLELLSRRRRAEAEAKRRALEAERRQQEQEEELTEP